MGKLSTLQLILKKKACHCASKCQAKAKSLLIESLSHTLSASSGGCFQPLMVTRTQAQLQGFRITPSKVLLWMLQTNTLCQSSCSHGRATDTRISYSTLIFNEAAMMYKEQTQKFQPRSIEQNIALSIQVGTERFQNIS